MNTRYALLHYGFHLNSVTNTPGRLLLFLGHLRRIVDGLKSGRRSVICRYDARTRGCQASPPNRLPLTHQPDLPQLIQLRGDRAPSWRQPDQDVLSR
jgi:hypothetical protein